MLDTPWQRMCDFLVEQSDYLKQLSRSVGVCDGGSECCARSQSERLRQQSLPADSRRHESERKTLVIGAVER